MGRRTAGCLTAGLLAVALAFSGVASDAGAAERTGQVLARQWAAYEAIRPKSIIELQPFRAEHAAADAGQGLRLHFIALNPATDAWFLLQVTDAGGRQQTYHLENPDPAAQAVRFDDGPSPALVLRAIATGAETRCQPWADRAQELTRARASALPYAPVCGGRLFLRNRVTGARTTLEATAEFLRNNVWGGENIVRFVRDTFFKDSQLETSRELGVGSGATAQGPAPMRASTPPDRRPVISTLLDIALDGASSGRMAVGLWYPVKGLSGVYASAFQPRAIAPEVLNGPGKTNRLDSVERRATGYMIAFDLGQFDLGYALGTAHPALGWSPRPPAAVRPRGMPGPDGVRDARPLVRLGMVNPVIANRTVATFTGGFKRAHGAFKFGDMATYNYGHHYGFIEKGTIFSKLQPGLSTLYRLTDGTIRMKTWTEADNALLPRIVFARQNGVPLLETDPVTGQGVPGDRVTRWGPGNWSGSAKAELRTLRAGACMAESAGTTWLIYGYFSTATPSAMARTFQAYGCKYAMLLDMNALEHTYLALYVPQGGRTHVAHIVPGMALIDKKMRGGTILPRFIGFADNRDFFYVMRKEAPG